MSSAAKHVWRCNGREALVPNPAPRTWQSQCGRLLANSVPNFRIEEATCIPCVRALHHSATWKARVAADQAWTAMGRLHSLRAKKARRRGRRA